MPGRAWPHRGGRPERGRAACCIYAGQRGHPNPCAGAGSAGQWDPCHRPGAAEARRSKRALLVDAYEALDGTDSRYGDRSKASQVARELAAEVGMQWGSARGYLYRHLDGKASS